jgi:SHS2 domain-containing protein
VSYELVAHTADIAVRAKAPSAGAVFAAVAEGLTAAMCETVPDGTATESLGLRAESLEGLLFDYLDELIYRRDVEEALLVEHAAEMTPDGAGYRIEASYCTVPLATVTARDIKAVTYSEMVVEERPDAWHAYVVFDV